MTQYLREQERIRQQLKQRKQEQEHWRNTEENVMKATTVVSCRFIPNCLNKHNKQACIVCRRNTKHVPTQLPIDNYKEKVSGMRFL